MRQTTIICPNLAILSIGVVGLLVYGWIAAYDYTTIAFQDSIEYLVLADFYRGALFGDVAPEAAEFYRTSRLPPIYPIILAVFGAGTEDQRLATAVTAASSIVASIAVYFWVRRDQNSVSLAVVIALAFLLYPALLLLNLNPVTEPLAVSFLVLIFVRAAKATSNIDFAVLAMLVGLAPLLRSATVAVVVAYPLWLALARRHDWSKVLCWALIAFGPFLLWIVHRRFLQADSYFDSLTPTVMTERLGGWPDSLWLQPMRVSWALIENWGPVTSTSTAIIGSLIILFSTWGVALRLRENRLDAWFLAGYIATILVWPFPFELGRFLVLAYPLVLLNAAVGFRRICFLLDPRAPSAARAAVVLAVIVVFASGPSLFRFVHRASLPVDPLLLGDKREQPFFRVASDESALISAEVLGRMRLLSEAARELIAEEECAYSVHPELQRIHGGVRAVRYPLNLDSLAPAQVEKLLNECDWFFLSGFSVAEPSLPALYPWKGLIGWTEPVLNSVVDGASGDSAGVLLRRVKHGPGSDLKLSN